MIEIALATLNARYNHASLGLRYLRANLGSYRERSQLFEFTIKRPTLEIVDELLSQQPRVVGFGVYIWNTTQTLAVVKELKARQPQLMIVLGGPEITYETETQELYEYADYVFAGEADFSFRDFIVNWFERSELPQNKIVRAELPSIQAIHFPYQEYTEEDIRNRTLYVEASRGCPYKCEYCLSSLDKSVRDFDCSQFLAEMQGLLDRGARQFKFVDRTFNLAPTTSARILEFFLARVELGLFLHFEMVPDRLPDSLKDLIRKFPHGALQFEIGIQTWSTEVAKHVSRRQNFVKIAENFKFLKEETGVHTHADLIVGLPGETWESFAHGFNELYALQPDEIQVGLLKRLKGTPVIRHDFNFEMLYDQLPPFQILKTKHLNREQITTLKIFADFWDLVANSGRFSGLKELHLESGLSPFDFYFEMSQWLFQEFQRTHSIHLRDLEDALQNYHAIKKFKTPLTAKVMPKREHTHLARQALHSAV